jgi:1-acyl-sn-glycerol-3-phosphate acyltransferase
VIRGVWSWLNGALATGVLAPIVIGAAMLGVRRSAFYDWAGRTWCRWNLAAGGARVTVEGLENIDLASPQILVGNHQSWFDVFAVAASIPKTYHFVAKKELERIFLFGRAWKAAGHISIDRSDRGAAIASLDLAGQQMRAENSAVVVFAEGTRSPTDDMLPFKKGAFMLAVHTGVPIVPFAVAGSRRIFPKGSWRVQAGPIIVRFGRPIPTEGLEPRDRDDLVRRVRDEVRRMRDEARRTLGPGTLENVGPATDTDR